MKLDSLGRKIVPAQHAHKKKHGYFGTKTYAAWSDMRGRCQNPNESGYERYGARGIKVCERWQTFENFLADMGEAPAGTSLDRINNDGNYEPGNCRWATPKQQRYNQRKGRIFYLTHQGETLSISEWARRTGLAVTSLKHRIAKGWSVHDTLTLPAKPGWKK